MNLKLIIVRGLPGSGKSTYARKLVAQDPSLAHFEADSFLEKDGKYNFNPKLLHQAHKQCQDNTANALQSGQSVVVSNTFTTIKEMKPYIEMAQRYNAELIIRKVSGNYESVHGVPSFAVQRMKERWQNVQGETNI